MKEYQSWSHTRWDCKYHVVFIPKRQKKFLFLLFTGLRRQEAATLKWSAIDLDDRSFTLADTKNRQPLTLPLTDFIYELLEKRKAAVNSDYVFAGDGKSGYLIEPRRQVQRIIQLSGVSFTLHVCAALS